MEKENEYFFDGKIKFDGEYLIGEKWNGKGKIYHILYNDRLIEEVEWEKMEFKGISKKAKKIMN